MKYCFDLDGTLTKQPKIEYFSKEYLMNIEPYKEIIDKVNELYNDGHIIIIHTARRKNIKKITKRWLKENNVKYHKLIMEKPGADCYVDDKGMSPEMFNFTDTINKLSKEVENIFK